METGRELGSELEFKPGPLRLPAVPLGSHWATQLCGVLAQKAKAPRPSLMWCHFPHQAGVQDMGVGGTPCKVKAGTRWFCLHLSLPLGAR